MIPRTEGFLTSADGEQIWYETAGTGPDLILTHGLGGNAAVWYQQVPYFAQNYRVITWDQRGFGRSTNNDGNHGPRAAVSDLREIMDLLNVDRAHIVGQSMGGWAALGTAIESPDRVESVVLACTTGGIPVGFGPEVNPPVAAGPVTARPLGVHPAVGERLLSLDPARAYLYQALGSFGHRPSDAEFFRILTNYTYGPSVLAGIDVPVLMIAGELDALMTPERIRSAAQFLPKSEVIELAERGHSPYFEDPHAWNQLVADFLAEVRTCETL
ncbi:alpha/beta fold hydrolase [Rhodococcus sp. ARC_M6]|uniref:alpha/beta fold hydrolase n=1 Tax=Rhodococcus sp. ARC_M6 TaxID=2928852 RepID=UPI001FB55360|nr:alpha/beta hydrolase [Rhodococcus sp. ARC_M6]MCJ0906738.1 alpha/beta hydrolase [Rhodococcus sp. ARC_M6]